MGFFCFGSWALVPTADAVLGTEAVGVGLGGLTALDFGVAENAPSAVCCAKYLLSARRVPGPGME